MRSRIQIDGLDPTDQDVCSRPTGWLMRMARFGTLLPPFLVVVGLMQPLHAQGRARFDASNLDQAVGMVYVNSKMISEMMKACRELHPTQVASYRLADYVWHGDNFDVVKVAQELMANMPKNDTQRQVVHAMERAGIKEADLVVKMNSSVCPRLANAIDTGLRDVEVRTPRAYAYLMAVYVKKADLVAKKQRNDVEVGCVKGYWNKGHRDFDKGIAFCRCTTNLVYTALSPSDRQAMFAQGGRKSGVADSAWKQKLRSKARPCVAILQSTASGAKSATTSRK